MELGAPHAVNKPTRAFVDKQGARDYTPVLRGEALFRHDDTGRKQDGGAQPGSTTRTDDTRKSPQQADDRPPGPFRGEQPDTNRVSKHFDKVRRFCEGRLPFDGPIDLRPQAVALHRQEHWPHIVNIEGREDLVYIYNAVRHTGLPNAMGARIPIPSKLNIEAWEHYLGCLGDRGRELDFVKYGFPMGYLGPISDTRHTPNHPSATEFPRHIQEFIDSEIRLEGLVGPFNTPPFDPWCHVSPLMTREKGNPDKRRIITDMTYPMASSINAYIIKNGVYGCENEHSLPTVDALARDLGEMGEQAHLATIDVSRAYTNFVSDPLDWPLLCFAWDNMYYCDLSMPFGARASSFHMQSVANCITDTLRGEGIHCYMYLDDLVILSPDRSKAMGDYERARQLLKELGLPEAMEKAQPPARSVKWLGVNIDAQAKTLSIPAAKLQEVLKQVRSIHSKAHITKRQLQSLLGHLLFVAKCVRPARVFVSRLLNTLRGTRGGMITVNEDMKRDLEWFIQFAEDWNGVSVIPQNEPSKTILVDACLTGVGGTDGQIVYAHQILDVADGDYNITELEAINVVIALHTLITQQDRGRHITVRCDNKAAVAALCSGRAKMCDCRSVLEPPGWSRR